MHSMEENIVSTTSDQQPRMQVSEEINLFFNPLLLSVFIHVMGLSYDSAILQRLKYNKTQFDECASTEDSIVVEDQFSAKYGWFIFNTSEILTKQNLASS